MSAVLDLIAWVRLDVFLALGFIVSVVFTIHILLTKRDVAAAVGWMALVWFSPFVGAFIYFVLGINRVRRRARQFRENVEPYEQVRLRAAAMRAQGDGHLRALARGISALTGRSIQFGNTLRRLTNGDEAYPLMLAAIDGATRSVGLSSYIFRADATGHRFIDALKRAQERGVEVRVIVDGIGSGWFVSPAYDALKAAGIPAGRFMHSPLPWRMPFLNLRTHRKVLLVDGAVGFTGGLNIGAENVVSDNPPEPVQDTHFELRGPVVAQLSEAFAADWAFLTGEDLDGPAWFPDLDTVGDAAARVITAGPDQDLDKIEFAVLQAIACARETIRVMTPYFLPDQRMMTALSLAAMRGVTVEVIIPARGNHALIEWATWGHIRPLIKDGCHVLRSPEPFRHSKLMTVDGQWSLIGSTNWDMRSFRLNFELCVEVYSEETAKDLDGVMGASRGPEILKDEIDALGLIVRLRNAAARLLLPYL